MRCLIFILSLALALLIINAAIWAFTAYGEWAQDIAETHRLAVPILSALASSVLCGIGWKRWRAAQAAEKQPR
jgi:Fe2+ transport system protein B